MEAIKECRVDHRLGKRSKKMAGLHKCIDRLIDVADKDHTGRRRYRIATSCERSGCHVVLHDLDAILVLEGNTCNFVKSDQIPHPHKPDLAAAHVVEQVCNGCLTARNQNAVRAAFFVDMAFAGAARPQFTDIVVVLDEGDHSCQQVPPHAPVKHCWLHTGRAEQDVDPFLFAKCLPAFEEFLHVHVRHLDRLQIIDSER